MKYQNSLIHYQGKKFKLLDRIVPNLPDNINNFYDLFGGSGCVSLNANANNIVYNDFNYITFTLFKNLHSNYNNYEDRLTYLENVKT